MFGTPSTPTFGTPSSSSLFSTPSTTPSLFGAGPASSSLFGSTPSSAPAFGSTTPAFGSTTPAFGSTAPAFATPFATPSFGAATSPSLFGTPSTTPAFGAQPQTPGFGSPFQTPTAPSFGFSTTPAFSTPSFNLSPAPAQQQFGLSPAQITTQMAPVAPLPISLADRDIKAIIDAYKDDPGNPRYAYRHLLFSVTEPSARVKPVAASDIMWAEAMGKLEGMDSSDRERLWPQLVQGFKDLSSRLKLQDEVLSSDAERLRTTHSNVKMLQRHFQADTLPWIQKLKQQEQVIQRRILRITRIVEALENKGYRIPLTREEVDLRDKLIAISKRLKGPNGDLSKKVYSLLTTSRVLGSTGGTGAPIFVPGSTKIDDQSIIELFEVLQQQVDAIGRLANVLKRDTRDVDIILSGNADVSEDTVGRRPLTIR